MAASATVIDRRANRRAFSCRLRARSRERPLAIVIQCPGGVSVPAPSAQKRAICVWSAVRFGLLTRPIRLTSRKAARYSAEFGDGGAGGRSSALLVIAHGVTYGQLGSRGGAKAGGVASHQPPPRGASQASVAPE